MTMCRSIAQFVSLGGQSPGVVHGRFRIVHRARSDDHDETVVRAVEDVDRVGATGAHGCSRDLVGCMRSANSRRRHQRTDADRALIVEAVGRNGGVDGDSHGVSVSCSQADPRENMQLQRAGL